MVPFYDLITLIHSFILRLFKILWDNNPFFTLWTTELGSWENRPAGVTELAAPCRGCALYVRTRVPCSNIPFLLGLACEFPFSWEIFQSV